MFLKDLQYGFEGFGLTTANIVYRFPDYHHVLQTYIWQEYDIYPEFPTLKRFLFFWVKELEGPLYSVTVAHSCLIKPMEIHIVDNEFKF